MDELLPLLAAAVIGAMFLFLLRDAERRYRRRLAAMRQAAWDAHVDQAVAITAEPIYARLAHEAAAGLDEEWKRVASGGWATE